VVIVTQDVCEIATKRSMCNMRAAMTKKHSEPTRAPLPCRLSLPQ
jgi:hypothetical protein